MSLTGRVVEAVERIPLPDAVTRLGIAALVAHTRRRLAAAGSDAGEVFARDMARFAIAESPEAANRQHYELPPEFFRLTLGPRRKYSCCLYEDGAETLAEAEMRALDATVKHAALADGQEILELGCGWGSLTLFMAERFRNARITAVSNARAQGEFITAQLAARRLDNVRVVTADMNAFDPGQRFDRVVSVEMFEHMANWQALLARVRSWLSPDGRLFLHVFSHRAAPYRFDVADPADWIAQHFFTGGIMPSHGLVRCFPELFEVEREWAWSGENYRRTAEDWLANFDANRAAIEPILKATYGADAGLWHRRWRLFYLATAGLFGHAGGAEWRVSHYRLRPAGT